MRKAGPAIMRIPVNLDGNSGHRVRPFRRFVNTIMLGTAERGLASTPDVSEAVARFEPQGQRDGLIPYKFFNNIR